MSKDVFFAIIAGFAIQCVLDLLNIEFASVFGIVFSLLLALLLNHIYSIL